MGSHSENTENLVSGGESALVGERKRVLLLQEELAQAKDQLRAWMKENGPGGWIDVLRQEKIFLLQGYVELVERTAHNGDMADAAVHTFVRGILNSPKCSWSLSNDG